VDDRVDGVFCKDSFYRVKIRKVTILKRNLLPYNSLNSTDCFSGGIVKIVEDDNIVSRLNDLNRLNHVNDMKGGRDTVWEPM
jgi:hypothetical protein